MIFDVVCLQDPIFIDLFGTCHTEQVKPGIVGIAFFLKLGWNFFNVQSDIHT